MSSPSNPGPGRPPARRPGAIGPGHVPSPHPGAIGPGNVPPRHSGDPGPGHVPPRHSGDPGPGNPLPPRPDPRKLRGDDTTGRGTEIDPFANVRRKIMDEYSRDIAEGDADMDRFGRSCGRDPASEEVRRLKKAFHELVLDEIVKKHSKEIEEIRSKLPPPLSSRVRMVSTAEQIRSWVH